MDLRLMDALPKISVVMASYLTDYHGGAKNRADKFHRAVGSFLNQTYPNKELVIVSDGCLKTNEEVEANYIDNPLIKFVKMGKQDMFSGNVRFSGVKLSSGAIICYLDTDDYFGEGHLWGVANGFIINSNSRWLIFDDYVRFFHIAQIPLERRAVSLTNGTIGTSNIAHLSILKTSWEKKDGYGHDWKFIVSLMQNYPNPIKIDGTNYVVCHIPNTTDV